MKTLFALFITTSLTIGAFAQSKSVIKCELWKPASFCNLPDSLSLPKWHSDSASVKSVSCENLDSKGNLNGVWLTINKNEGSYFYLESNFKNLYLIKKNNQQKIHPVAILWNMSFENKTGYMSSDFKTNSYKAKFPFKKIIDLVMIFPDAEKGDRIYIDNFIESEIK